MEAVAGVAAIGSFCYFLSLRNAALSAAAANSSEQITQGRCVQTAPYLREGPQSEVQHYRVSHLVDQLGPSETFPSPLLSRAWPRNLNFISLGDEVIESQLVSASGEPATASVRAFLRAGPLENLAWNPTTVRAAIVTCGGLCPGINTVIREVVMCLYYVYGVQEIFGVPSGYRGFYNGTPWLRLTPCVHSPPGARERFSPHAPPPRTATWCRTSTIKEAPSSALRGAGLTAKRSSVP
jgi:Phosphofructokinase